jgi:multidrug efflux pump subunit AcrB
MVFGMAVFFVFLVLAAQYESLTLPLSIILIVPMCCWPRCWGSICGGWTTTS